MKVSKFGAGLGAPSKEERLKEAADIHVRLGNIQKYCEILLELGEVNTTHLTPLVYFILLLRNNQRGLETFNKYRSIK